MSIIKQKSRISHHTVDTPSTVFTVPSQEDFTVEGTMFAWNVTDLCYSEIGVNEADDKVYIRIGPSIHEILTSATPCNCPWINTGTLVQISPLADTLPVVPFTDDTTDLGSSTLRWKDLYLGSVINFATDLEFYCDATSTNIMVLDPAFVDIHSESITMNGTAGVNVATGTDSLAIGNNNTASGTSSFASGGGTQATASYTHTEGFLTQATVDSAHAEGSGSIASANSSHAEGSQTTASGAASHSEGNNTVASHTSTHAGGSNALSNHWCEWSRGSSPVANQTQYGTVAYTAKTTNASAIDLHLNGSFSSSGSDTFFISNDTAYYVRVYILGVIETTGETTSFKGEGTIKNVSGTTTMESPVTMTMVQQNIALATVAVAATNDNVNDTLRVVVQGIAATNIRWTARIDYEKISF